MKNKIASVIIGSLFLSACATTNPQATFTDNTNTDNLIKVTASAAITAGCFELKKALNATERADVSTSVDTLLAIQEAGNPGPLSTQLGSIDPKVAPYAYLISAWLDYGISLLPAGWSKTNQYAFAVQSLKNCKAVVNN